MTTNKYKYKGVDVANLITTGATGVTGYNSFPSYTPAATNIDKPLPFGFKSANGAQLSTLMKCKFVDYTTVTTGKDALNSPVIYQYNLGNSYDSIRAVLSGGGGGGGGRGGCGWNDAIGQQNRNSGSYGNAGTAGSFTYLHEAIPINMETTAQNYWVGAGGGAGSNGGDIDKDGSGSGANGNSGGAGRGSYITFRHASGDYYIVSANGGAGGSGGGGGNANSADGNRAANGYTAAVPVTYTGYNDLFATYPNAGGTIAANQPTTSALSTSSTSTVSIPANVEVLNYLNTYSKSGNAESGGTAPTAGQGGFIRMYLLKQ